MRDSPSISHISVCICTFKRPARLTRLLAALEEQVTDDLFRFSVVIVDNDFAESARAAVASFVAGSRIPVKYSVEPEQNIAMARNHAIAQSEGNLIALIDDDEFPNKDWLVGLFRALHAYRAQGVLGPVKPHFELPPPGWIVKGAFCERPAYPTGTVLREPKQTRTGNALLQRSSLVDEVGPFDPRFGRTGGEDVDFFRRRLEKGDAFVWCDEAAVFESVPSDRMTRSYFLRRALLRGVTNAEKVHPLSAGMAKSLAASVLYTAMLPALLLWRHDLFMRFLIRDCDHIGKVFAVCGIKLVRQRSSA